MTRAPARRRREEEDLEQVRQRQLDEQVMEKKLLLRQQFYQKEESSRLQDGEQSGERDFQYRFILDGCYSRNLELRKRLDKFNRELLLVQNLEEDETDILISLRNIYQPQANEEQSLVQSVNMSKSQISVNTPQSFFNIQRIQKQLIDVRERYSHVENQMMIENQLTISLLGMQDDIADVKRRLGKKVQELKRIHQVLHTHFENHDDVKDRYQHREQEASQNLDSTKKQLQNLSKIEQAYTLKVVERRKHRKKVIEREENLIGHVEVRLEEARRQNDILSKRVEELLSQELIKKSRNDQFFFIGQYVALFEELEKYQIIKNRFFAKGAPDDVLMRYHIMSENQEKQIDLKYRKSIISATPSARSNNSTTKIFPIHASKNDSSYISKLVSSLTQRERRLCEIFLNQCNLEYFDRQEIVLQIDSFYEVHRKGPNFLVDMASKIFSQLQVQQNSLQSTYQQKSHEQGDKKRIIESLVIQCEDLMVQHTQVEKIENDPFYNENFDNQRVALDSGMIKVVKNELNRERDIFNCVFQEQMEPDLTTINKVRFQGTECSFENMKIQHEFKINEIFILNLFTYLSELLSRICYSLVWLSEYTQMIPLDLDHRCITVLKRISQKEIQLWIPSYNQPNQQHTPPDVKQNFLQIFQQATNQKQEKRGSFINIMNRKKSSPYVKMSPLNPQAVGQSTQSLTLNTSKEVLQSSLVIPLSNILLQKLPSQKLGSFLKILNFGSSFNEDNTSETFRALAMPSENPPSNSDEFQSSSLMVNQFRLKHCPKATEEWKDLLRNDKLSAFFIRQEQSVIIENLYRKIEKNQPDDLGLITIIYDSYVQIVQSASQSLQELLEFLFQNYSEIIKETHYMSHQTKEDIKELQQEKDREQITQIQVQKLVKKDSSRQQNSQGTFLKDMTLLAQKKQQNYLNSEDVNPQSVIQDGAHFQNDEKKYHLQFILDSNIIQRKNTVLHKKLIGKALQNIDELKKLEMVENYYSYTSDVNQISDHDYLDTERKHLKLTLNKNQIDLQRQQNGLNVNKQSNSQINAACIDRFFVDINNFETQEIKQIYKSASLLQKITNLEMMNKSNDHLNVKKKVIEDQMNIAKRFHRETMKVSTNYDKPNQLYQLRMKINVPEMNQIKERKNRSLIKKLRTEVDYFQNQQQANSLSPLVLPRLASRSFIKEKGGIVQYNSTMEIEEEPISQGLIHSNSIQIDTKVVNKQILKLPSKFEKKKKVNKLDSSRSIQMEVLPLSHHQSPQDELNYLDLQHEMMNYHLDMSLNKMQQKTVLVDKEAANNYGFNLIKF